MQCLELAHEFGEFGGGALLRVEQFAALAGEFLDDGVLESFREMRRESGLARPAPVSARASRPSQTVPRIRSLATGRKRRLSHEFLAPVALLREISVGAAVPSARQTGQITGDGIRPLAG